MRVVACAVVLTVAGAGICLAEDGLVGGYLAESRGGQDGAPGNPAGKPAD